MKKAIIDYRSLLHQNNLKATELRCAILKILATQETPLSASDITKELINSDADIATVYRALAAFVHAGIVRELAITKDKALYEFINTGNHRHHVLCNQCGTLEAIFFCIKDISTGALRASRHFKSIDSHCLSFLGTCKKCTRTVR